MRKIKVMSIFGTRPETIKMAPVVHELEKREEIESIVCVTAQHREMLDQVLKALKVKPDYDLNIMKQGQTLSDITTRALKGLEDVIKDEANVNKFNYWLCGNGCRYWRRSRICARCSDWRRCRYYSWNMVKNI